MSMFSWMNKTYIHFGGIRGQWQKMLIPNIFTIFMAIFDLEKMLICILSEGGGDQKKCMFCTFLKMLTFLMTFIHVHIYIWNHLFLFETPKHINLTPSNNFWAVSEWYIMPIQLIKLTVLSDRVVSWQHGDTMELRPHESNLYFILPGLPGRWTQ